MTPFCPYCETPTVCLQEPNNLPPLHLLSNNSYRWRCNDCGVEMAYAYDVLYVMFKPVHIGPYDYMVQLRSNQEHALYVYKEQSLEELLLPDNLANQLLPSNIESKIRTYLTFS